MVMAGGGHTGMAEAVRKPTGGFDCHFVAGIFLLLACLNW